MHPFGPLQVPIAISTSSTSSINASSDSAFGSNTSFGSDSILNHALDIKKTENNLTFGFLNSIEDLINNLKSCDNIDIHNLEAWSSKAGISNIYREWMNY